MQLTSPALSHSLFEKFIAEKLCTACSRTNYRTDPPTKLNKYLYSGKSEIKAKINNSSEEV
jgi:hypothetical protein